MFARRLKQILEEKQMTPYRLAKITGVSQSALSRYLKGMRQPTYDIVCRFADALGVSVDDFREK